MYGTRKDTELHGTFLRVLPRSSVSQNGRFPLISLSGRRTTDDGVNGGKRPFLPSTSQRASTPKTAVFSQLSHGTRTNTDERGQTAVSPLNFSTCNAQKRPFSPNFSTCNTQKRPFFPKKFTVHGRTRNYTELFSVSFRVLPCPKTAVSAKNGNADDADWGGFARIFSRPFPHHLTKPQINTDAHTFSSVSFRVLPCPKNGRFPPSFSTYRAQKRPFFPQLLNIFSFG